MQPTRKRCLLDINADLGEQIGNDAAIMPYIGSCNIACGGHAGDPESIRETVDLALKHGVKIGAHPGYPDRENFGRKHVTISKTKLVESLLWQISQLQSYMVDLGQPLHHIKLHGALYNEVAVDASLASIIIAFIKYHFPTVSLYVPFGSQVAKLGALADVSIIYEVFSDRRYQDDYTLVPRTSQSACLQHWEEIQHQVLDMVQHQQVKTVSGNWIPIQADTICVHGDNPEAIQIASNLHRLFCEPYPVSS